MKLSEAIRLGAMMKPQGFNGLMSSDRSATCAAGAAYDAVGLLDRLKFGMGAAAVESLVNEVAPGWIAVIKTPITCPECGWESQYACLAHLNDTHRWTRERIADWVETIENAQVQPEAELETLRSEQA